MLLSSKDLPVKLFLSIKQIVIINSGRQQNKASLITKGKNFIDTLVPTSHTLHEVLNNPQDLFLNTSCAVEAESP